MEQLHLRKNLTSFFNACFPLESVNLISHNEKKNRIRSTWQTAPL